MADIPYEIAVRFGTAAYQISRRKHHTEAPAEREIAEERLRPLTRLDLPLGHPIYWLHAVSLGEVSVAAILAQELKQQEPDAAVVVSTATATGWEAACKIPEADAIVAARFDHRDLVSSMFDAIRPTAIVLIEGDLWRNMIALARRRDVPVFVANAKLSEKSLRFYGHFPLYSRSLFSRITRIYAQTETYRRRFVEAGLPKDRGEVTGNIKLDSTPPKPSLEEIAKIKETAGCTGAETVITFGSLHPGEEIPAIRGMQQVWQRHPTAHGLIAPRHLEKTPQFLENIRCEFGLNCRIYSEASAAQADSAPRITLIDKMGLLRRLYALADIGVVGGTFISSIGGHNLTEPSFYGKPVIYGPYVYTQTGLHDLIMAYEAGQQATEETFPSLLAGLVDDHTLAHRLGANGLRMVEASRGVAARVIMDIRSRVARV